MKSIKSRLILFLVCFALFLAIKERDGGFLICALAAVISASALESAILFFKTRSFRVTESSIITGLIVGFVLSGDQPLWVFASASALAVLSKYLIRFRNRHIFNPAAFGILLSLVIFGAYTQWRGTYIWYILLPFGLYFARGCAKMEILAGYALVSLGLFGTQAILRNLPAISVFGYLSYFFIFIMVIEPKTTPAKSAQKFIFGASLAGLIFILTENGVRFDAELFSLLAMNAGFALFRGLSVKKGDLK